jgi:4'-phosphopantetheinyl transferase
MRPSPLSPVELHADADGRSTRAPRCPRLAPGELHVWVADLARVDDSIRQLLDEAERERERQIARARERSLWARSRGVVRELLARYVPDDAHSLRIDAQAHGKLVLAGDRRDQQPLHFNVSHSGALAVCALAESPVGVDVELVPPSPSRRRDHVGLARRAFGAPVADRLVGLNDQAQEREFLRLWTRHEAVLKLGGGGIGGRLGRTAVDAWIIELDLGAGAVAAAASQRPAVVRVWSFA